MWEEEWTALEQWLTHVAETHLTLSTHAFILILLFLFLCILIMVKTGSYFIMAWMTGVGMFVCCRSRRPSASGDNEKRNSAARKGLFALMFARLDEFDSLTPLIVTPASSSSSSAPLPQPTNTVVPRGRVVPSSRSPSSPPPPRRPLSAKTLIVPLNTSRYRCPVAPLLGTPDSRVTSFETGTTKSCATIPEDDEEGEGIDLISIDRTSMSYSTEVKSGSRLLFPTSSYNLHIPQQPPSFQLPVPTYTPPEPPMQRPTRLIRTREEMREKPATPASSDSSLGSPASSVGTASPIDTTGSLSDSFYLNHQLDAHNNHSMEADRCLDEDSQSKYQLHRIEEESEHLGEESAMAYSRTDGSIASVDGGCRLIPRSISEQFEIMHQRTSS